MPTLQQHAKNLKQLFFYAGGFTGMVDVNAYVRLKENLWKAAGSPLNIMQLGLDCCK